MITVDDILKLVKFLRPDAYVKQDVSCTTLEELGLDSLDIIKFLVLIQEEYSVDLINSKYYITNQITVGEIINEVNNL